MSFKRIASIFVSIVFFVFLAILSTSDKEGIEKITFKGYDGEDKTIMLTESRVEFTDFNNEDSKFKQKTVSILDNIYYLSSLDNPVEINEEDGNINITTGEGLYYFNFGDLNKSHIIKSDSYQIQTLSAGRFFLDSRDKKNIKIMSFDSVLNVDLLNVSKGIKVTEMALYPHMILKFKPVYNKVLKKADYFRISKVNSVLYEKSSLFNSDNLSISLLVKLGYKDDDEAKEFLSLVRNIYEYNHQYAKKQINYLSSLEISNLSAIDLIRKYFNLFQNKQKKIIYYKNIALKEVNNLFQKVVRYNPGSVNELYSDLLILKELSEDDYNEVVEIIDGYYEVISIYSNIDYSVKRRNFALLLSKIHDVSIDSLEKDLYLSSIYSSYDTGVFEKEFLTKYLNIYFNTYYKDDKGAIKKDIASDSLKSVSFYFNEIIKTNISLNSDNIHENIKFIENYKLVNDNLAWSDPDLKKTFVFIYTDIFESIMDSMRTNYFKDELGESEELIRNKVSVKQEEAVVSLQDLLIGDDNSLGVFVTKNQELFGENKKKDSFFTREVELKDYFLALINYDKYQTKKKNEFIFNSRTLGDIEIDNSLSVEKLHNYLKGFKGISFVDSDLELVGDGEFETSSYKAKIFVENKAVEFKLVPHFNWKMDDILIDGEPKEMFFELESVRKRMKKSLESAEEEDQFRFKFENFFIVQFGEKEVVNNSGSTDIKIVKVDPRDANLIGLKLLNPENGDFRKIDFSRYNFTVNNIIVESKKFLLKDVPFTSSYKEGKSTKTIRGTFSGVYLFGDDIHNFANIKVKFYKKKGSEFTENYDFGGFEIGVNGTIGAFQFQEKMDDLMNIYGTFKKLYYYFSNSGAEFLDVVYDTKSKLAKFNLKLSNNKKVSIMFDARGLLSTVSADGKVLNKRPLFVTELDKLNLK